MLATEHKPTWQHLREEGAGSAMIHLKDGDRFALPMDEVILACRSWEKAAQFSSQVSALLDRLANWLSDRQSEFASAFLGLEPDGVIFVVVRKSREFDPGFEDALSLLDLEVAHDVAFNLIKMRVLALPFSSTETVASFLEIGRSFKYVVGHEET
jgi:hypothetical protein